MAKGQKRSGKGTKSRKTKRSTKQGQAKRTKKSTSKGSRKSGQNSNYNLYMKQALSDIKAKNPNIAHNEAFKVAAQQWSTSPDNPKNQH